MHVGITESTKNFLCVYPIRTMAQNICLHVSLLSHAAFYEDETRYVPVLVHIR